MKLFNLKKFLQPQIGAASNNHVTSIGALATSLEVSLRLEHRLANSLS